MQVKMGRVNINIGKTIMPFGKYKGEYLDDMPTKYLMWLFETSSIEDRYPGLYKIIEKLLDERDDI
jgi:uncharacterized protein (DUF3820 family)